MSCVNPNDSLFKILLKELKNPLLAEIEFDNQEDYKPGVSELFDSIPELESIGTEEQYSQYLDSIFPDSKVKDIVYHGTKEEKFENVDITKSKWGGKSFYVTTDKSYAKSYAKNKGNTIPILIDAKNIKRRVDAYAAQPYNKENLQKELNDINSDKIKLSFFGETGLEIITVNTKKEAEDFIKSNSGWEIASTQDLQEYNNKLKEELTETPYDTILTNVEGGGDIILAVFEPEQIHILGTKQDIEGFKKFVGKTAIKEPVEVDEEINSYISNELFKKFGVMVPTVDNENLIDDGAVAAFNNTVAMNNGILPAQYYNGENNAHKWILNKKQLYDLVDKDTSEVYLKDVNLTTGVHEEKLTYSPINEEERDATINSLNDAVKDYRIDEILAEKGYDVNDIISNLEAATTQEELDKIINKLLRMIC